MVASHSLCFQSALGHSQDQFFQGQRNAHLSPIKMLELNRTSRLSRSGEGRGHPPGYSAIGIGGSLAAPPLPHHRAYGSVHGGSTESSGVACGDGCEAEPVEESVGQRDAERRAETDPPRAMGVGPAVKLKARKARADGRSAALLAAFTVSFSRRARKLVTLAMTRSPARRDRT